MGDPVQHLTHPTDAVTDDELLAMLPASARVVTAEVSRRVRAATPDLYREKVRQRLRLVAVGRAVRVETRTGGLFAYEYRLVERRAA